MPEDPMRIERDLDSSITGFGREFKDVPDPDERQANRAIRQALRANPPVGQDAVSQDRLARASQAQRDLLTEDQREEARRRMENPDLSPGRKYEQLALIDEDPDVVRMAVSEFLAGSEVEIGRWDQYAYQRLIRDLAEKAAQNKSAANESLGRAIPGIKKYPWFLTTEDVQEAQALRRTQEYETESWLPRQTLTREERKRLAEFYSDLTDFVDSRQAIFIAAEYYSRARPSASLMAELATNAFGGLETVQLMTVLKPKEKAIMVSEAVPGERLFTDMVDLDMRVYLLILQAGGKSLTRERELKITSREDEQQLAALRIEKIACSREPDEVSRIEQEMESLSSLNRKITPVERMKQDLAASPQIGQLIRDIAGRDNKDEEEVKRDFTDKIIEFARKNPFYLPNNETKLIDDMRGWVRGLTEGSSSSNVAAERFAWRFLFMTGLVSRFDDRVIHKHIDADGKVEYRTEPFAYPMSDADAKLMHFSDNVHKETRRGRDDGPDATRNLHPANFTTDFWHFTKVGMAAEEGHPDLRPFLWEDFILDNQSLKALDWEHIGNGAVFQWAETIQLAGKKDQGMADLILAGTLIEPGKAINDKSFAEINTTVTKLARAMADKMLDQNGKPWLGGDRRKIEQRLWELVFIGAITSTGQDRTNSSETWGFFHKNKEAESKIVSGLRRRFIEAGINLDWQFIKDESRKFLASRQLLTQDMSKRWVDAPIPLPDLK